MPGEREYIKLWLSYAAYFEPLSDAEVGRLTRAMIAYRSSGAVPKFSGNERFLWPAIQRDLDQAELARQAFHARQAENGARGGRPRKVRPEGENPENPGLFSETQKSQGQGSKDQGQGSRDQGQGSKDRGQGSRDRDQGSKDRGQGSKDREQGPNAPPDGGILSAPAPGEAAGPAFEAVLAAAEEQGCPALARPFFDYYAAGGWRDSQGKRVLNWRQKLVAWQLREEERKGRDRPARGGGRGAPADVQPDRERIRKNNEWLDDFLAGQEE